MSNSRILSNVPSDLATQEGRILAVVGGNIVWIDNTAANIANQATTITLYKRIG